jgi:ABC-type glycerol-3-phosphate transport system substrate-binding protein
MKKWVGLILAVLVLAAMLSACGKAKYTALDTDISGELSVMLWSGDNSYIEDIGHKDLAPEDLLSQNIAATYATAKAFNAIYPNVKISVYAKSGGPDDNDTPWAQELENFKAEHGAYPSLYASTDLVGDISKGLVADLSVFKDDPMYQSFNKSVMDMMNFDGFQGGLPQYLIPWGVYVNKSLAENNNLDVPDPDWTIDEYVDFVSQANNKDFWGAMDVPLSFIESGSKSIIYQMAKYDGKGDYVNLNGDDVKDLINYIPKMAKTAIWPQNDLGNIPAEVMEQNGWWSYNFFINNKILTLDGDPWMMGDAAHPNPDHWGRVKADDWDIYPRPATKHQPITVGVVLDPFAVHNYALDDGNPELSETEEAQLKLAYTFATFWVGDTRAIRARADQKFNDNGTLKTCLNDSFPLVTGDAFKEQMDIWYEVETHQRFADKNKMPGFHKVLEIWEKGQFWDISDKSYPYYFYEEGTRKENLYEWKNYWNKDITGALRTDANFVDVLKSKLNDWNIVSNERFRQSAAELKEALKRYYGYTD